MDPAGRLLPDPTDEMRAPFWREAGAGRLSFQRCPNCGYLRWPPAALCPECWVRSDAWEPVEPSGRVWSFAVYDRAYHPAFAESLPYVVALVELDAGPRIITNVIGIAPDELEVEARVTAVFEPFSDDMALVKFRPAGSGWAHEPAHTHHTESL